MKADKTIILKNDLSEIPRLASEIEVFGKKNNLSESVIFDALLASEEIFTNIVSYAYEDDKEHMIVVRVDLNDGELTLEIEEDGRPFDPLKVPEPDIEKPLEERPVGGLGVFLARKSMDELEYRRKSGKNILVMKKRV